jgi:hypothetical protein
MTVIELADEDAAALKAKAATPGMTLEAWLKQLAASGEQNPPNAQPPPDCRGYCPQTYARHPA